MRSADTDPESERVQIKLLAEATPAARASLALSLSRMTMELTRRAISRAHPGANADQLAVLFVAQCYGAELAASLRDDLEARRSARRP